MSDIVWVAFISAGGALMAAITTQWLATLTAAKQAARAERIEALQWQRSETKRIRELHEARLRELWAHVLQAQNLIRDALDSRSADGLESPIPIASNSATSAAAQAYSVALIGVPGVRSLAKEFYQATAKAEMVTRYSKNSPAGAVSEWRDALDELEAAVIGESATLQA